MEYDLVAEHHLEEFMMDVPKSNGRRLKAGETERGQETLG
jgi:hypothetical protein